MATQFTEEDLKNKGMVPDGNGGYMPRSMAKSQPKPKEKPVAKGRFSLVKKDDAGMNKTEALFAKECEARKIAGEIHDWWFEKITLKIAHDTRLTPDFTIQQNDGTLDMIDIKGSWAIYQDDAKVKMKVAANMFPFRFFVKVPIPEKRGGGWETVQVKSDHK